MLLQIASLCDAGTVQRSLLICGELCDTIVAVVSK